MSKVYLPHAEQFDLMNENLARIANAIGSDTDISTWAGIQKAVRVGIAPHLIPAGTQLVVSHSKYGDMLYDVVAHNHYKSAHDENAHTMTLMCHDIIANVQYDYPEAFYHHGENAPLPAGTYNFTLESAFEGWKAGTYQFTMTSPLPVGGQLCINCEMGESMTSGQVISYLNSEAIGEVASIASGNGGTSLGTFGIELNHTHRVAYGSDNYKESAIRQFLNSSAEAGGVWSPQTKFDMCPIWDGTLAGFINGLDENFLAVVGEVVVPCAANAIYESPDSAVTKGHKYTVTDRFYLASVKEIVPGITTSADDGSILFPYYNNANDVDRVKYRQGTASVWWTRSSYNNLTALVTDIIAKGSVSNHYAPHTFGVSPVCTIV